LPRRSAAERYGFAAAAVTIAFLSRLAFHSFLGERLPFASFMFAVVLTAWYSGFIPSLLAVFAGYCLAAWFFLPPADSLTLNTQTHIISAFSYIVLGLTSVIFGRAMHLARERADANALEALGHLKKLEAEVTERRRAEDEIRRLNAELEKRVDQRTAELVDTNRELESFTYSVSHDLRAPLRHMDGYAQLLEEEYGAKLPEEGRDFTHRIRQASQNMGRLVDDLLNLSRVGKKELACQQVELRPLIQDIVKELNEEAPQRRINWKIDALPSVECDAGLMKLAFTNLLANSVKYTRGREEARIEVGQMADNSEPVFFVRDNGVGFNMKYVSKLFGVFQRLHRSEEFEGTGVGLATVARVVHKHGGRVWAEGKIGEGATFYLTLGHSNGSASAPAAPAQA
jgi:signal transduction histidine kinase